MKKKIRAVDLFCGAGGTSKGLSLACHMLGAKLDLTAVNHWSVAIDTHAANHPEATHLCESLDSIDPRKLVKGELDLLVASPECTHHSIARGGKPMSDQGRSSAWHVVRWAEALRPLSILVENVREFMTWGPLGADGRPLKRRKGEIFQAWVAAIRSLGYVVDWRVLNAANYGDPTTRERLFVQARRGRRQIRWPDPTHSDVGGENLFGSTKQWRAAREIIDWSIPGQSIFTRKKPLAPATLERIAVGLRKFGGAKAEPFLVVLRNHQNARSLDKPVPTMTTSGANFGLCEPFIFANRTNNVPRKTDAPVPTLCTGNHIALIEPMILGQQSNAIGRPVSQPLPTIATAGAIAMVEPFLVPFVDERGGQAPRFHSVESPHPTVTGQGSGALVEPVIIPLNHGKGDIRSYSMDRPMPTITTIDAWGMVEPFLVQYNGTADARTVAEPLGTQSTKDRFGLVEGSYTLDIRFRMLQPHELSAAMGFPTDYQFSGNRGQRVKQIGNAVAVNVARALCFELLTN